MTSRDRVSILMMLGAMLCLSGMDILLKYLSTRYPLLQLLFFRYAFGFLPVLVLAGYRGDWTVLRPRRWWVPGARAALGLTALACFVYAIRTMSLASAVTLFFAAPILLTLLSLVVLKQKPSGRTVFAVALGLLGVLIALRPGRGLIDWMALLVLAAATAYALAQILAHKYGDTESGEAMTLWMNVGAGLACAIALPFVWQAPTFRDWLLFGAMGLVGGVGLFLLTESMRRTEPAILGPFEYTAVIWAVCADAILWSLLPDAYTLGGCVLIALAGILTARKAKQP